MNNNHIPHPHNSQPLMVVSHNNMALFSLIQHNDGRFDIYPNPMLSWGEIGKSFFTVMTEVFAKESSKIKEQNQQFSILKNPMGNG